MDFKEWFGENYRTTGVCTCCDRQYADAASETVSGEEYNAKEWVVQPGFEPLCLLVRTGWVWLSSWTKASLSGRTT